jgi:hypothetical protein
MLGNREDIISNTAAEGKREKYKRGREEKQRSVVKII